MVVEADDDCPEPIFALTVKNTAGTEIYGTNTLFSLSNPRLRLKPADNTKWTSPSTSISCPATTFSFGFIHFVGEKLVFLHRRYDAINIEIHGLDRTFGIAQPQGSHHLAYALSTERPTNQDRIYDTAYIFSRG